MLSQKGGTFHKRTGMIYFVGMTLVFFTAVPLSLAKTDYFLFSVGIFSYYAAFTGFRYSRRKNDQPGPMDHLATGITLITGGGMIFLAVQFLYKGATGMAIVLGVFGLIAFLMSLQDSQKFWLGKTSKRYQKRDWFFSHIVRMGASYIAASTAFAVTNLNFWPPLLNWLVPTIIGSILISRVSRSYYKKFFSRPS